MGYLTTITIYNDSAHLLNTMNPAECKEFCRKLYLACVGEQGSETINLGSHVNAVNCQKPRHADDVTVYIHRGNCLFDMNPYGAEFKRVLERFPDSIKADIKVAQRIITQGKEAVKKFDNQKS